MYNHQAMLSLVFFQVSDFSTIFQNTPRNKRRNNEVIIPRTPISNLSSPRKTPRRRKRQKLRTVRGVGWCSATESRRRDAVFLIVLVKAFPKTAKRIYGAILSVHRVNISRHFSVQKMGNNLRHRGHVLHDAYVMHFAVRVVWYSDCVSVLN